MLRLAINILILLFLFRLMKPLFDGARKFLARAFSSGASDAPESDKKVEYSELTPYEIEDAEYEELREKKGD